MKFEPRDQDDRPTGQLDICCCQANRAAAAAAAASGDDVRATSEPIVGVAVKILVYVSPASSLAPGSCALLVCIHS